jgi:transcriptional regulator with XRE-family HTH domain
VFISTKTNSCNNVKGVKAVENLYLDVGKVSQKEILQELKSKAGLSWTQLSKFLGVRRNMALFYNNGTCKLPYKSLLKLCKLTKTPIEKYQIKLVEIKNKVRPAKLPALSDKLAEFLGIHYGDGSLFSEKYAVCISCDAVADKEVLFKIRLVIASKIEE